MWCEAHNIHFDYPTRCLMCVYEEMPRPALATIKRFFLFFFLQFASYALICWNYRVVAKGWVVQVVVSDILFGALNFTIIKKVAEAKGWVSRLGYIAGGATGSAVSVLLTKYLWGS